MSFRSLNKVMLIGNLTRDPELRYTNNGTQVCTFGVATNRSWKDASGEVQEFAEFSEIVAWGKVAEICSQILRKGVKVYIEGSLHTRSWEGEDGKKNYRTEVRLNDVMLLTPRSADGGSSYSATGDSNSFQESENDVEENDDKKKKKVSKKAPTGKSPEELLEELTDDSSSTAVVDDPLNDMPF